MVKVFSSIVLLILLSGCSNSDTPLPLVGTLERDRLELIAEAREAILEIPVTEGQTVTEGQLLARLDASLYEAQVSELQAVVEQSQQRLAELVRGPRKETIAQAEARLAGAQERLGYTRKEYERIASLRKAALVSQAELDTISDSREAAAAGYAEARAALQELLAGTTVEELQQARAVVAQAEAAIATLRVSMSRLDIRAPRAGTIETLPYKMGERPPPGAPVVVMLAGGAPYARVYVPESLRAAVTAGLRATIRVDGVAGELQGTVRYVAHDAAFTPYYALTQRDRSRLAFLAEVTLTGDQALSLPSGVPVEVDFPSLK